MSAPFNGVYQVGSNPRGLTSPSPPPLNTFVFEPAAGNFPATPRSNVGKDLARKLRPHFCGVPPTMFAHLRAMITAVVDRADTSAIAVHLEAFESELEARFAAIEAAAKKDVGKVESAVKSAVSHVIPVSKE